MGGRMMISAMVCVALAALARGKASRARLAADAGFVAVSSAVVALFGGIGAASSAVFCAAAAVCAACGSAWGVVLAVFASAHGAAVPSATFFGGLFGLALAHGAVCLVREREAKTEKIVRAIAAAAFAAMAVCTAG